MNILNGINYLDATNNPTWRDAFYHVFKNNLYLLSDPEFESFISTLMVIPPRENEPIIYWCKKIISEEQADKRIYEIKLIFDVPVPEENQCVDEEFDAAFLRDIIDNPKLYTKADILSILAGFPKVELTDNPKKSELIEAIRYLVISATGEEHE